ncbi:MAG: 2-oxoacid:acceptor oxidoreductase subunit alpha [Deltaproteobacteria bacterium]|nr:2-oxoacid:acceptor oxidoreductase subunit alpha [Deltaproteobacteria bacterium]NIS76358.1 2-oxoacid:acceptor oxidoreductase subunit alpha [Deltaproteobacteria bacterium]
METWTRVGDGDVSVVIVGEAGQGIQTLETLLTWVLKDSGYHVFATKEFMSRVRGGSNSTSIRVAAHRVDAYVDRIDILIPLAADGIPRLAGRISPETIIIGEKEKVEKVIDTQKYRFIDIPFTRIASDIGGGFYANIVATGVIACIFDIESDVLETIVEKTFADKDRDVIDRNLQALGRGCDIGIGLIKGGEVANIPKNPGIKGELLVQGTEAVALGAIAGGCNFISSYPMSPSTGVLTTLSRLAGDFGIIAEQAEDEISAINMAIGAWYAGARAIVTTSGGGFDLMTEGLSLAGMIESPLVIHLAQRPGPATGLPTRTEQGDLNLALFGGHGEFPRIILTPGTLEEAFNLTRRAFYLADKYQVPVFILTDQFLLDSYYNIPGLDATKGEGKNFFTETEPSYRRYALTDTGISPRGIPGYGSGLVVADSDEHDEEGHITEDLDLRVKMVEKRLSKTAHIRREAQAPRIFGSGEYETLVLCWGSTGNAVKEAVEREERSGISALHFSQVYPISEDAERTIRKAKRKVVLESNATSQFGSLIGAETGIQIDARILKYNGLPFSVEEIRDKLGRV